MGRKAKKGKTRSVFGISNFRADSASSQPCALGLSCPSLSGSTGWVKFSQAYRSSTRRSAVNFLIGGEKGWCPWKAGVRHRGCNLVSLSACPISGSEEPWPQGCCCWGKVTGYRLVLTQIKPHRTVTTVSRVSSVLALQPPRLDTRDEKTV